MNDSQSKGKILIIDDDDQLRRVLQRSFERRGFEAFGCGVATEAVQNAHEVAPDLITLDLKMVTLNGLDLLPGLLDVASKPRIVVLTGYGSIATAQEAIRRGATQYLTKPCDADRILESLEQGMKKTILNPPTLAQVEWDHINRILADCNGNITRAAKSLGMDRRSLQRKLGKVPPLL